MGKRAVRQEDKERKREKLVRAAGTLLGHAPFERISMARIARQAGVAKGTVYLYFRTKEELFLEVHRRDYLEWFAQWHAQLAKEPTGASPGRLAAWMIASLRENRRFLTLLAIVSSLLEKNVGLPSAREFKRSVRDSVVPLAPQLRRVLRLRSEAESYALIACVHALFTGLWHNAAPAPVVEKLISSEPEFALFRLDYFALLEEGLNGLFRGARRPGPSLT